MVVFGYIVFPCHCGMACNPLCSDTYGICAHWIEYDENELIEKIKKLGKEKLEELAKRIMEHRRALEAHANACGAPDCHRARAEWNFEFNKQLLEEFNVKYKEKSCRCKECEEMKVEELLKESVWPDEIIVENLPEDIYIVYFAW